MNTPQELPTAEQVLDNLKSQLQSLYADKSIIEDKIFELKAQADGFASAVKLEQDRAAQAAEREKAFAAEAAAAVDESKTLAKEDSRRSKAAARARARRATQEK